MKRSTPLRRTPFKRKAPNKKLVFTIEEHPDPFGSPYERRVIGRKIVFTKPDGSHFVPVARRRTSGGERTIVWVHRTIYIHTCSRCRREYGAWTKRSAYCSKHCSKRVAFSTQMADQIFSRIVRLAGACLNCGATEALQCAHVWSRSYHAIRWDKRNAMCLCAKCHAFFTYHPIEWTEFCEKNLGETYRELRMVALSTPKVDKAAILDGLHEEWARLTGKVQR